MQHLLDGARSGLEHAERYHLVKPDVQLLLSVLF